MNSVTSIAACRTILMKSGSSFTFAFRALPSEQRDALTAFYAFCRRLDDEVDNAPDRESARGAIQAWKSKIDSIFRDRTDDCREYALQWAIDRFAIPREYPELVLAGVEQDLSVHRFESFSDLYDYCYRVAASVGLVCVAVLGEASPRVNLYAELCGVAVQLTNILRDVAEDADRGRIYLPMQDLRIFGVREQDVLAKKMTRTLKGLLRFEASRAEHLYDLACAALPYESRHHLFFCEALRETYQQLLYRLIQEDFPVFRRRVSISTLEKLSIVLKYRLNPATFLGRLS